MTEVLDALYQLRILRGRCESGADLDMGEIQRMAELERQVPAEQLELPATLKNRTFADHIWIGSVSAARIVCHGCPWMEVGDVVEIVIDIEHKSYRFKMLVSSWHEDDGGDIDAIMTFVGVPLLLRRGPKSRSTAPSIQRIAA